MSVSRRLLIRSTAFAALAGCLPPLWAQLRQGRDSRQNSLPSRGSVAEFGDELRLSHSYTVDCAGLMPEERYLFRPVPEERTFGQQMVHVAESLRGVFEVFVEGKVSPTTALSEAGKEPVRSKADVIARLRDSFDYVERAVASLIDSTLLVRVQFLENREFSRQRVLRFILDHTTHHRGQAIVYMRLNGVRPPQYRA